MKFLKLTLLAAAAVSGIAAAQPVASPKSATQAIHIPASGGEVVLPGPHDRMAYDRGGYATVRRSGDLLFLSGVIVARRSGEGTDVAAFKNEVRRAFKRIGESLGAAGSNFDDVVMINSFHVWNSPDFAESRDMQFEAFEQVKEEFMHGPHPAWTAVGSSGLLGQGGIVEVQIIAHASRRPSR
jgi:enamine deaminase RidA (YjgF/YER057c/UK114 family)